MINAAEAFPNLPPDLALAALRRQLLPGEEAAVASMSPPQLHVLLPHHLRLRGGAAKLHGSAAGELPKIHAPLVEALKRAHRDLEALQASPLTEASDLHGAAAPETQYERQLSRLAFLSPDLQRRILAGLQPAGLSLRAMLKTEMPLAWVDQVSWLEEVAQISNTRRPRSAGEFSR